MGTIGHASKWFQTHRRTDWQKHVKSSVLFNLFLNLKANKVFDVHVNINWQTGNLKSINLQIKEENEQRK